jgi:hypothetical protein
VAFPHLVERRIQGGHSTREHDSFKMFDFGYRQKQIADQNAPITSVMVVNGRNIPPADKVRSSKRANFDAAVPDIERDFFPPLK